MIRNAQSVQSKYLISLSVNLYFVNLCARSSCRDAAVLKRLAHTKYKLI